MSNKTITITNLNVIDFFEKNEIYEPNSFFNVLLKQFLEKKEKLEKEDNTKNEKILISKEELKIFYEEYKFFINQKTTITGIMKEAYKESQCNLNRIKFTNLDNFFTKYLNIKKPSFVCDICRIFTVSTKKGLITHKRKCSKTNGIKDYDDDEEEEDEDVDEDYEEENKKSPQKQLEKIEEPIQKTTTQPILEPKQTIQPTQTIPTQQSVQIPQSAQLKQPTKPLQGFQGFQNTLKNKI